MLTSTQSVECLGRMSTQREADERIALLQGMLDLLILKTLVLGACHGQGIARAIRRQSAVSAGNGPHSGRRECERRGGLRHVQAQAECEGFRGGDSGPSGTRNRRIEERRPSGSAAFAILKGQSTVQSMAMCRLRRDRELCQCVLLVIRAELVRHPD